MFTFTFFKTLFLLGQRLLVLHASHMLFFYMPERFHNQFQSLHLHAVCTTVIGLYQSAKIIILIGYFRTLLIESSVLVSEHKVMSTVVTRLVQRYAPFRCIGVSLSELWNDQSELQITDIAVVNDDIFQIVNLGYEASEYNRIKIKAIHLMNIIRACIARPGVVTDPFLFANEHIVLGSKLFKYRHYARCVLFSIILFEFYHSFVIIHRYYPFFVSRYLLSNSAISLNAFSHWA